MGRFLVFDVVFKGKSLNYDEGVGNSQRLKVITLPTGKEHTIVSSYALKYSMIETSKAMGIEEEGIWQVVEGKKGELFVIREEGEEEGEEKKGKSSKKKIAIIPAPELIFTGKVLFYPEFNLFGFLFSQPPVNHRESCVKVTHAVSLTPFRMDRQFCANISLAHKWRKIEGGPLAPNPFEVEEHLSYYGYTAVVDLERIPQMELIYTKEKYLKNLEEYLEEAERYEIEYEKENITKNTVLITYRVRDRENFIRKIVEKFTDVVLHLKRNIKGRCEDLSPKILVLGVYKNAPYMTFLDRIKFGSREGYRVVEEREEKIEEGKKVVKTVTKLIDENSEVFRIKGLLRKGEEEKLEVIDREKVMKEVSKLFDSKEDTISEWKIFYSPEVELLLE